jgi:lipoprotein-anchoring transpeptidase ErfK/SrfK
MRRSGRIIVGAAVAALVAVAALIAYFVAPHGATKAHLAARPAQKEQPVVTSEARHKRPHKEARPRRTARPHVKAKPRQTAKPRAAHHRARPATVSRGLPWREDGTSLVAHTRGRWLAVYRGPGATRPATRLRNPDTIGSPRVVLVHSTRSSWVRVYLPDRPNGHVGWVRRRSVELLNNPYRIVVHLRAHRLDLWRGRKLALSAKTVVGKPTTPTPRGMFFVVDLLRPSHPDGSYGPFAFNLSAHSNVLKHFGGGDGVVAIHGTNAPWLLGQSASHGCVRVSNRIIRRLAHVLPLGTPVLIRS